METKNIIIGILAISLGFSIGEVYRHYSARQSMQRLFDKQNEYIILLEEGQKTCDSLSEKSKTLTEKYDELMLKKEDTLNILRNGLSECVADVKKYAPKQ